MVLSFELFSKKLFISKKNTIQFQELLCRAEAYSFSVFIPKIALRDHTSGRFSSGLGREYASAIVWRPSTAKCKAGATSQLMIGSAGSRRGP